MCAYILGPEATLDTGHNNSGQREALKIEFSYPCEITSKNTTAKQTRQVHPKLLVTLCTCLLQYCVNTLLPSFSFCSFDQIRTLSISGGGDW